ncbi:MAG TPA: YifB family Mg chelatase-like AAA ATPase [Candidatus Paenalcaligenes intestinipullorum]|uniref:YifB family Mg chelatase-like AAA ATPase n=1 Tax=Candidatus Paenalcaligenes intestinipullorum TaxID=2838718 RepID=A0A9D2U8F5_9BURK|nr:YifB family Mg chelatase-like AAA ATPase [Candidatus Paenalcaligenes intestinipullorum]
MSLAVVPSCALAGLTIHRIQIEVHVSPGLPAFTIVGLPDTSVRESRERVRAALLSSGYNFPSARITVNLAPAELPKEASHFDLPIALGVLLASGQLETNVFPPSTSSSSTTLTRLLQTAVFLGELSLTGVIMPLAAPLAVAVGLSQAQIPHLIVPQSNAKEMALVSALCVYGASSLQALVQDLLTADLEPTSALPLEINPAKSSELCFSDVQGQQQAKYGLFVAAAGGHNVLMKGPPGVGKSMLAQRFIGLLPPLSREAMLEVAAIWGIAGVAHTGYSLTPPFRAPHHTSSMAALIGGGVKPRPGEISLAHHGVLFLDEVAEFKREVLESLREPLESHCVNIARAYHRVQYPAKFQLLAAMNPCPCGWYGHATQACVCRPEQIRRYAHKLSGPFLDRLDMHILLSTEALSFSAGSDQPSTSKHTINPPGSLEWHSFSLKERVACAQAHQLRRQGCLNAVLAPAQFAEHLHLSTVAQARLEQAANKWSWSRRTVHRIQRVARTLADLAEAPVIQTEHLMQAISYRL